MTDDSDDSPMHLTYTRRIQLLEDALRPFAAIADQYDEDGLDECRPDWVARGVHKFDLDQELYSGRGGKQLMTLRDVIRAREALTGKPYKLPGIDPFVDKVKRLYQASLSNLLWEDMSEERRNTIIENYRKLESE
jgi:hypothetical protein